MPRQSEQWARLRNELPVERENAGLRNELEPSSWAWKCGAPERAWAVKLSLKKNRRGSGTSLIRFERENASLWNCQDASGWRSGRLLIRGAAECFAFGLSRPPWAGGADKRVEIKGIFKTMVSGTAKSAQLIKWWCSGTDFFVVVICENDTLRNGNSGLKMEVSRAAHTYKICLHTVPPPPPEGGGGEHRPSRRSRKNEEKTTNWVKLMDYAFAKCSL